MFVFVALFLRWFCWRCKWGTEGLQCDDEEVFIWAGEACVKGRLFADEENDMLCGTEVF